MTDKELLVNKLRELGYKSEIVNNIPYIFDVSIDDAKEIIKDLNYNSSWGVVEKQDKEEDNDV